MIGQKIKFKDRTGKEHNGTIMDKIRCSKDSLHTSNYDAYLVSVYRKESKQVHIVKPVSILEIL